MRLKLKDKKIRSLLKYLKKYSKGTLFTSPLSTPKSSTVCLSTLT